MFMYYNKMPDQKIYKLVALQALYLNCKKKDLNVFLFQQFHLFECERVFI